MTRKIRIRERKNKDSNSSEIKSLCSETLLPVCENKHCRRRRSNLLFFLLLHQQQQKHDSPPQTHPVVLGPVWTAVWTSQYEHSCLYANELQLQIIYYFINSIVTVYGAQNYCWLLQSWEIKKQHLSNSSLNAGVCILDVFRVQTEF